MTSSPRVLRWGLLVAQAACIDPAWAPPDPVPVALLTPDVWSGGEAVLASAAFTPDLPTVLLNGDTLVVRRLDDTTVAAQLPDLPGTQSLHVLAPDVLDFPIAIELRGFESAAWGPLLGGRLEVLPGWPPSVVGSGVTGAVLWNLQSSVTLALPDTLHHPTCVRGVGPSYDAWGVTLAASCAGALGFPRWWSWRLRPGVQLAEDTLCGESDVFMATLAPGVSATVGHHQVTVYARDGAGCVQRSWFYRAEETYDIVISPRGDRAVVIAGAYHPFDGSPPIGVPVLDAATGRLAYAVAAIIARSRGAFSADGDTLFVSGEDAAGERWLVMVRASDGMILRSVALPFSVTGMAIDPSRPWLYVAGYSWPARRGHLLVLDRDSLGRVTMLTAPDSIDGFWAFGELARVIPSPMEQRVYVVAANDLYSSGNRPFLTRFRTPP